MSDEAEQYDCYIGKLSCGCVVAACVDIPRCKKETAQDIASWVRDGMTVERVTGKQVRLTGCEDKPGCALPKLRARTHPVTK